MKKIFVILICIVSLSSCSKKESLDNVKENTKYFQDFRNSMIEYEKIYLLSSIYNIDKDTIINMLSEYYEVVPVFSLNDDFNYTEVIEKISSKYDVEKTVFSRIILEYNYVGI